MVDGEEREAMEVVSGAEIDGEKWVFDLGFWFERWKWSYIVSYTERKWESPPKRGVQSEQPAVWLLGLGDEKCESDAQVGSGDFGHQGWWCGGGEFLY